MRSEAILNDQGGTMAITVRSSVTGEPRTKGDRRRARLVELLGEGSGRSASVNELAQALDVSVVTIRRDLALLEKNEVISRTYGGASLAPGRSELTMAQRQVSNVVAKEGIAQVAVSLLSEGDLVILDAGSTAERIAAAIDNRFELTVVTNGLRCINRLVGQDKVHVLVLGGNLRGINETICGGDAEMTLSRIYGNIAFVGADAVSAERGIASRTYDQSRLKSMMLRQASQVYVIADSSKLEDDTDYPYWSPLPHEWGLITDAGASAEQIEALEDRGATTILLAGEQNQADSLSFKEEP
ncbi:MULTISPECIES: DeoR/GlpR family DNA-binding transcription regulator [unclassified Actinomyces]|uniref:DeoR/GlpR family DNA-binding transcription regulator n=1 Tax=unclassified Actinomyces TaxID=2609248 RepID=UPI00137952B4|nr:MULTISPECIES: DeoR/GlpR family DNA-binding transcription regulator [unclassified Actinomyces]MBW3068252.1 DeoR/GlpR transcriptional regulator [Actinomyces sp. 594]NDR53935.1 DeoR/GlpR transcriptional regulator [Actinomyces sp. 565]